MLAVLLKVDRDAHLHVFKRFVNPVFFFFVVSSVSCRSPVVPSDRGAETSGEENGDLGPGQTTGRRAAQGGFYNLMDINI